MLVKKKSRNFLDIDVGFVESQRNKLVNYKWLISRLILEVEVLYFLYVQIAILDTIKVY